jgi:spermidine synthase
MAADLPPDPENGADVDERPAFSEHVQPYVQVSTTSKTLHFSIAAIQSRMSLDDPYALNLAYTRTMMGFLLLHPAPRDLVMIGLGGGSLAKFCHRYLPAARIAVVEINPHVIALRDEFEVPAESERFRVLLGDGAKFVRQRTAAADVLLVDGFDTDGLPSRLCSQRFYDDCQALLRPGGVLVVNLHFGHRQVPAQVERIRRSFDGGALLVDDGERANSIVFACKGPALERSPGMLRRPPSLERAAAEPLAGAFTLLRKAIASQRAG